MRFMYYLGTLLILFQLVYADERSTLAHMNGLAEMIRTRGGLQSIEFRTLREMLTR
jgi:hypothetical protein